MISEERAQAGDGDDHALDGSERSDRGRANGGVESRRCLTEQVPGSGKAQEHLGALDAGVNLDQPGEEDEGAVGPVTPADKHLACLPAPDPSLRQQGISFGLEQ
jgi:hypothetical protein